MRFTLATMPFLPIIDTTIVLPTYHMKAWHQVATGDNKKRPYCHA